MTRGRVAFAGLLLALSAHSVSAAAPAPAPAARLSGYPLNPTTSRLIIQLQSAAAPELRAIDGAIELHFAKGVRVAAQHVPKLRQIAKIDVLPDADGDVLTIHFAVTVSLPISTPRPSSSWTSVRSSAQRAPPRGSSPAPRRRWNSTGCGTSWKSGSPR